MDFMKVRIHNRERIVIPKSVRDALGFRKGGELPIEESPQGILVRALNLGPSMVKENGFWVHLGKAPQGFDSDHWIDIHGDERIKDISGVCRRSVSANRVQKWIRRMRSARLNARIHAPRGEC
jgi:AbrB family looped-hinge helix DNA binding protein